LTVHAAAPTRTVTVISRTTEVRMANMREHTPECAMLSKAGARQGIHGIGLKSREGACPRAWNPTDDPKR
jgi:hypothetical protein